MSGKNDDTPEDDDRTQLSAFPGKETMPPAKSEAGVDPNAQGEAEPTPEDPPQDNPDATQFAPLSGITESPHAAESVTAPPQDQGTAPHEPQPPANTRPPPAAGQEDDRTQFVAAPVPAPTQPPASTKPPDTEEQTRFVPTQAPIEPTSEVSLAPVGAASTAAGKLAALQQPKSPGTVETTKGGSIAVGVGTLVNNNYEITHVLKSGGMGEVYRGVEIGTGDPVAIKAILPELAEDEKAGLLFKREARTLRQLADEAIVRYYNYVHDRDLDRYFLVMEFIEGVPLSDHIENCGAIPAPAAMTLLKRLAKGLSNAHAQDVIHRDLSPDNVMLPEGDVTQARLIDFGIAKSNVVTEGTMHGQFAGKFKYVAPEQLGHFDGIIGPATDIYGLALLTCSAAMGRPLDMGASIVEAVQSRQNIPDLSALPEILRPIMSHMLEPDPLRRPASMQEVRRMLENPAMIPMQYREGVPLPPPVELTGRAPLPVLPQMTSPPPGLQVPMGGTTAGFRQVTLQNQTAAPMELPEVKKSGRSGTGLMALVFIAALGGGGWYAWQSVSYTHLRAPRDS